MRFVAPRDRWQAPGLALPARCPGSVANRAQSLEQRNGSPRAARYWSAQPRGKIVEKTFTGIIAHIHRLHRFHVTNKLPPCHSEGAKRPKNLANRDSEMLRRVDTEQSERAQHDKRSFYTICELLYATSLGILRPLCRQVCLECVAPQCPNVWIG